MKQVEQKILTVNVVDVAFVSVDPSRWPRVNNHERVASELETWLSLSRSRAADFKSMLAAERSAELVVGDATPTMVRRALRVLG